MFKHLFENSNCDKAGPPSNALSINALVVYASDLYNSPEPFEFNVTVNFKPKVNSGFKTSTKFVAHENSIFKINSSLFTDETTLTYDLSKSILTSFVEIECDSLQFG